MHFSQYKNHFVGIVVEMQLRVDLVPSQKVSFELHVPFT